MYPYAYKFTFSIIVCTRNRASKLRGALESLAHIDYPVDKWELILVDNGSTDNTSLIFHTYDFGKIKTAYVFEKKTGLSNARNAGIRIATGKYIVFTDDDCYVNQDLLKSYADEIAENNYAFLGGQVVRHTPETKFVSIQESKFESVFSWDNLIKAGAIHGANMCIKRDLIREIGEFDPLLGAGAPLRSGEDYDLLLNMNLHKYLGKYSPKPSVRHDHDRQNDIDVHNIIRGYDIGRGAVFTKHLLSFRSSSKIAKFWYWEMVYNLKRKNYNLIFSEIKGGISYLVYKIKFSMWRRRT